MGSVGWSSGRWQGCWPVGCHPLALLHPPASPPPTAPPPNTPQHRTAPHCTAPHRTAPHHPPSTHLSPHTHRRRTAQAYFILDELLLAGELQETSKKAVGRVIEAQDQLVEQVKAGNVADSGVGANFSGPRG